MTDGAVRSSHESPGLVSLRQAYKSQPKVSFAVLSCAAAGRRPDSTLRAPVLVMRNAPTSTLASFDQVLDVIPVAQGSRLVFSLPPRLRSEEGDGLDASRSHAAAVLW